MILRYGVVTALFVALAAFLAIGVASHWCPGWSAPVIWLGLLLLTFLFEVQRYRPRITSAGPWKATGERFIDPATGERLQVFVNGQTGERDYRRL